MANYAAFQYSRDFGDVYSLLDGMERDLSNESLAVLAETEVFPYLREKALNRFPLHGDEATGNWPSLRESTVERRINAGFGGSDPINIRTGELEKYIEEASPNIYITGGAVVLDYPGELPADEETSRKYTTAQQGRRDRSRTPPRPIIGVSTEDFVVIREMLFDHIMSGG